MMKVMLVGSVGSGKTTLSQRLRTQKIEDDKTQTMIWEDGLLDTPGEYVDHGYFKNALLVAAFDADLILMLAAADGEDSRLPPLFAAMFNRPVIGVVTKTDIATPLSMGSTRALLDLAGAHEILEVSSQTGDGITHLIGRIDSLSRSAA